MIQLSGIKSQRVTPFIPLTQQLGHNLEPDIILLDRLKIGFGLKTDSALANFLGISRTNIHKVRHHNARLGVIQRLKVLDRIGFLNTRQWVEKLASENLANGIRTKSKKLANYHAAKKKPAKSKHQAEADLLELVKLAFNFNTDFELGNFLGLARNTVSMVRNGKTSLGPKPRLKILNAVNAFDIKRLERALESSEYLIEEIEIWANSPQKNKPA